MAGLLDLTAVLVLVMAAPPGPGFVAALGGSVEPVVHAEERIHAAPIGRIGVVGNAVLERERAHARPFAMVREHVGPGHGRELGFRRVAAAFLTCAPPEYVARRHLTPIVVVHGAFALLLLSEGDVEIGIELAAERRRPGKRPAHPLLVRL